MLILVAYSLFILDINPENKSLKQSPEWCHQRNQVYYFTDCLERGVKMKKITLLNCEVSRCPPINLSNLI